MRGKSGSKKVEMTEMFTGIEALVLSGPVSQGPGRLGRFSEALGTQ